MTIEQIISQPIQSSSRATPEWKSMYRKASNAIKKQLSSIADDIQISRGHFYLSGFFTAKNGQIYYFSIDDVRWGGHNNMLIRTADSYKDYTGGRIMYIRTNDHFKSDVQSIIGE